MKAFLDTHAAVALYEGEVELFGRRAADLLERSALFVSPIVRLELVFLNEVERVHVGADDILDSLAREIGVLLSDDPVQALVTHAKSLSWTRDPFDRLLVATAMLHRAPFITQDRQILQNYKEAVW